MLLSMYLSYHWAKSGTFENYFVKMAVFIILTSLLSAYSVLPFGVWLVVCPVLSFPFYAYVAERVVGPPLYEEEFRGIRFFAIGGFVADLADFISAFWFFLFVNFIGVALGYAASKIHRIRELGTTKHWNLLGYSLGFISGVIFIGVGLVVLRYIPLPPKIVKCHSGLRAD